MSLRGRGVELGGLGGFQGGMVGDVSRHQHSIREGLQKIDWQLTFNEW